MMTPFLLQHIYLGTTCTYCSSFSAGMRALDGDSYGTAVVLSIFVEGRNLQCLFQLSVLSREHSVRFFLFCLSLR